MKIESGDPRAWATFVSFIDDDALDGEHAQTYTVACAELARRDPTLYLRHHLLGDERALRCAKRAYRWISNSERKTLNAIYLSRLQLATDATERQKIETFIQSIRAH